MTGFRTLVTPKLTSLPTILIASLIDDLKNVPHLLQAKSTLLKAFSDELVRKPVIAALRSNPEGRSGVLGLLSI